MVKLINPQNIPISHTQDGNRLHCHQQEHQQLHRNQEPSKSCLQGPNGPTGINGLSRPMKTTNSIDHEGRKRITQRLALIFHSHRCISEDESSVKNFGTVQTAVSTYPKTYLETCNFNFSKTKLKTTFNRHSNTILFSLSFSVLFLIVDL